MKQKAPRLFGRPCYINYLSFPDIIQYPPSARIKIMIEIEEDIAINDYHLLAIFKFHRKYNYLFQLYSTFFKVFHISFFIFTNSS